MFEKNTRLHVRKSLEEQFKDLQYLEQAVKSDQVTVPRSRPFRSTNERNMTRKTRSRQLRIHSAFQSGFCAVCHTPYNILEEHIQSKRHLKLIGDDADFISIKTFDDSLLSLDSVDSIEYSGNPRRNMPRTRTSSVMCDRVKDSPMSPVGSDLGHRLRSRKNINYMTPPLEEDSLSEKPEVVKEYRELRSSTRLLAKLTDEIVDTDEVWNSGRPKRACSRTKISADERLVIDNKSYYKVEVLTTKLRSGVAPFHDIMKRPETPEVDDKGLLGRMRKMRSSELSRLNNEAENFLFPKRDDTTTTDEDDDEEDNKTSSESEGFVFNKKMKLEDDDSQHSTSSESHVVSKGKKRRRTQAEVFINDNQKYYKFETPGSRLRYQGSFMSSVHVSKGHNKNNGVHTAAAKTEMEDSEKKGMDEGFKLNLEEFNFSFETVPRGEDWFRTFQRRDHGQEKYAFLSDDNYWNPFIMPYQLDHVTPLNPQDCITQYTHLKKFLVEPPSASTSVTCSTPDPTASNSSTETPFPQDEDSKISAATDSTTSTLDELKPLQIRKRPGRRPGPLIRRTTNASGGKNPRKSPRQHASTLAILSSLIQQRKRKSRNSPHANKNLSTVTEENKSNNSSPVRNNTNSVNANPRRSKVKRVKIDYFSLAQNIDDDLSKVCCEDVEDLSCFNNLLDKGDDGEEIIDFRHFKVGVDDILSVYDLQENDDSSRNKVVKKLFNSKPGRKPGKRKKNRTGWPLNRSRRIRRENLAKEEDDDNSTVDSLSVSAEETENLEEILTENDNRKKDSGDLLSNTNNDSSASNNINDKLTVESSENNNKNDQKSSLVSGDETVTLTSNNCDFAKLNNSSDRVGKGKDSEEYQPYVRVQKLDKNHIEIGRGDDRRRSSSPKRTNRGQRRMPASPKSPRMLRRPRGRWYRER